MTNGTVDTSQDVVSLIERLRGPFGPGLRFKAADAMEYLLAELGRVRSAHTYEHLENQNSELASECARLSAEVTRLSRVEYALRELWRLKDMRDACAGYLSDHPVLREVRHAEPLAWEAALNALRDRGSRSHPA